MCSIGNTRPFWRLAEDTHLVMLRTERLESLADEQETRELLALQSAEQKEYAEQDQTGKNSASRAKAEEAKPAVKGGKTSL